MKESTKKLLELINDYREVARYKTSKRKSIAFQYINGEQAEFEI